ncbi:unnamed protein product [Boreogadus saida]
MSVAMRAADGCFLSALQPNSSRTSYGVPSDMQISDGPYGGDAAGTRARRVQEQVRMRLAEKKCSSIPRLNGSTDFCPPPVRCYTANHGFSSRSLTLTPSRVLSVATAPLPSACFSSRSAVETDHGRFRISQGSSTLKTGGAQGGCLPGGVEAGYTIGVAPWPRNRRSKSLCQEDMEDIQVVVGQPPSGAPHQAQDGWGGGMRRSLSGTLARAGGGASWQDELAFQQTYKGPSHRTISRITNRQQQQQTQSHHQQTQHHHQQQQTQSHPAKCWVPEGWAGTGSRPGTGTVSGGRWGGQHQQQYGAGAGVGYQEPLYRAASLHSVRSVGRGVDLLDRASNHSVDKLGGMQSLNIPTAVRYLLESDPSIQVQGAAYIQHQCYHSNDAKNQVRTLSGIPALVQLFSSENQEVQRFASGAARNLIYENADNKAALIAAGGVAKLVHALREPDEELRKNVTGILWNLSSKENLKEKLSREALPELTERVLVPLCCAQDAGAILLSPSEEDVFYNATGCLRNLSSVNERTRQKMREMRGLVDSLVAYVKNALQEDNANDKGVENTMCILRNLSYQLYAELPHATRQRLEGPSRANAKGSQAIGCFPLQSKKLKELDPEMASLFSEVSGKPRGAEWLWHPQVVALYKAVLQNNTCSSVTREAALGALQNITVGESRWPGVLSYVILEQERMLPLLLELLDTRSEEEMRPLTGLLRNLACHARDKSHMAKSSVNVLVAKLPADGHQKDPGSEVVVNLCGALNQLVTGSSLAARDLTFFDGIPKLLAIKTSHDNSTGGLKAAKAASTVLLNMFQYNKLHKDYKQKGFTRRDFTEGSV